ncbi:MAG: glycosyl hydrolase, partial [Gammaproteobacteria bacterium]
ANRFETDIRGLEVYRSDDAGETWRRTHDEPIDSVVFSYGYYFGQLRVSPADPERLYALGVPIVMSRDGGQTWEGINPPDVHVDHHALWIDPEYPDRLLLGNDGGLDVSYDGGETWRKLDDQPVGQFYTVNVDFAEPYNVYGGLQDNGTMKCSSANDWRERGRCSKINGGDGMYVAIDPRDNETVITGYQFGWYTRLGKGPRSEVRPRDELGEPALRYNWNSPVILSPHNPDIVYFGSNRVYRSMDQGDRWTAISPDLTRSEDRGNVPFATVTSLSESPLDFGLLWAGTDDGQLWVTETGGKDWKDVADRLPRDRWVSRVEASPHARARAYVALNGYRDDDIRAYVYRTDDLGKRWRDISKGLPAEPVNVIREDPLVPELLYVGTDRGVYVSTDGGDSWEALDAGLPNVPVHDLVVHPRDRELVAGTHGRSIWIADVLPLQEVAEQGRDATLRAFYVDPVRPEVTAHYWLAAPGAVTVEVADDQGRVLQRWETVGAAGLTRPTWDLRVDESLALAAEEADAAGADDPDQLANRRYAESVRLGHRLYVLPGDDTLRVAAGGATAETELEVKAPEPFKPRHEPPFRVRGRDD